MSALAMSRHSRNWSRYRRSSLTRAGLRELQSPEDLNGRPGQVQQLVRRTPVERDGNDMTPQARPDALRDSLERPVGQVVLLTRPVLRSGYPESPTRQMGEEGIRPSQPA